MTPETNDVTIDTTAADAPAGARAPRLLVVEDDQAMQQMCVQLFQRRGYEAIGVTDAERALELVRSGEVIDLVLSDIRLGRERSENGLELLRQLKALRPEMPVILMTGYATVQDAVEAMKLGAADYVTKPFERTELLNKVEAQVKVRALESEVKVLREALDDRFGIKGLIGGSEAMRKVCERIEAAGRSQATVLITGESGTGKELVARAIHHKSVRREKPFVPVNCAALPENLIESELFGHEPGAFTGAAKEGLGLFRAANTGSIFLDEVADMPKDTQAKLLRVLQDHRVRPVGSTKEIPVDVRVIAATNWNVDKARAEGQLRDDLFFRLSVIRVHLPPLRERMEDVPLLVQHFLAKHGRNSERRIRKIAQDALNAMLGYSWPGNVRELESAIESAYALGNEETLQLQDLPGHILSGHGNAATKMSAEPSIKGNENSENSGFAPMAIGSGVTPNSNLSLNAVERDALVRAMQLSQGNKSKAAQMLGVSRKRLYRMLYEYGLAKSPSGEEI